MVVARVIMGMEMRYIFVLMNMAMDKIVGPQESNIFQDIFRTPVPRLSLIFAHDN